MGSKTSGAAPLATVCVGRQNVVVGSDVLAYFVTMLVGVCVLQHRLSQETICGAWVCKNSTQIVVSDKTH